MEAEEVTYVVNATMEIEFTFTSPPDISREDLYELAEQEYADADFTPVGHTIDTVEKLQPMQEE